MYRHGLYYSNREDDIIVNYIKSRPAFLKGRKIWEDLVDETGLQRTWMSVKSRFKKHIVPRLTNRRRFRNITDEEAQFILKSYFGSTLPPQRSGGTDDDRRSRTSSVAFDESVADSDESEAPSDEAVGERVSNAVPPAEKTGETDTDSTKIPAARSDDEETLVLYPVDVAVPLTIERYETEHETSDESSGEAVARNASPSVEVKEELVDFDDTEIAVDEETPFARSKEIENAVPIERESPPDVEVEREVSDDVVVKREVSDDVVIKREVSDDVETEREISPDESDRQVASRMREKAKNSDRYSTLACCDSDRELTGYASNDDSSSDSSVVYRLTISPIVKTEYDTSVDVDERRYSTESTDRSGTSTAGSRYSTRVLCHPKLTGRWLSGIHTSRRRKAKIEYINLVSPSSSDSSVDDLVKNVRSRADVNSAGTESTESGAVLGPRDDTRTDEQRPKDGILARLRERSPAASKDGASSVSRDDRSEDRVENRSSVSAGDSSMREFAASPRREPASYRSKKSRKYATRYTASEDRMLLEFVLKKISSGNLKIHSVDFWQELVAKNGNARTCESMKSRFRMYILRNLNEYDIPEKKKNLLRRRFPNCV